VPRSVSYPTAITRTPPAGSHLTSQLLTGGSLDAPARTPMLSIIHKDANEKPLSEQRTLMTPLSMALCCRHSCAGSGGLS